MTNDHHSLAFDSSDDTRAQNNQLKITPVDLAINDELREYVYSEAKKTNRTIEHQVKIENHKIHLKNLIREQEEARDVIFGLDNRQVVEALKCSHQELARWIDEGKLPFDGLVDSYRWRSMGRGTIDITTNGWLPETIARLRDKVEQWRFEHKQRMSARKKGSKAKDNHRTWSGTIGKMTLT
jgi:hypothetical protein